MQVIHHQVLVRTHQCMATMLALEQACTRMFLHNSPAFKELLHNKVISTILLVVGIVLLHSKVLSTILLVVGVVLLDKARFTILLVVVQTPMPALKDLLLTVIKVVVVVAVVIAVECEEKQWVMAMMDKTVTQKL